MYIHEHAVLVSKTAIATAQAYPFLNVDASGHCEINKHLWKSLFKQPVTPFN